MSEYSSNNPSSPSVANRAVDEAINIADLSAGYDDPSGSFGRRRAVVDGLNLQLLPGTIYALIGSNGSGKSTILRAVVDPRFRSRGSVTQGQRPVRPGEIAYVPQNCGTTLFPWRSGIRNARLWGDIHGPDNVENPEEVAARYGMMVPLARRVTQLSGGERVQVALIRALCVPHRKLLVLDEPFEGLDATTREVVLALLLKVAKEGTPILLTSHRMDDIEILGATAFRLVGTIVTTLERLSSTPRAHILKRSPYRREIAASPAGQTDSRIPRRRNAFAVLGVWLGLILWTLIGSVIAQSALIPGPGAVLREMWPLLHDGHLLMDIVATTARAVSSWLMGLLVALPVGTFLGYHRPAYSFFSPWLTLGRGFPVFTLTGIAIGLFAGTPEIQRVFLVGLTVFLIALQIVASAAFAAPRRRVELARVFGASGLFCLTRVMVFESIGGILGALETTLPLAFVVTLVIESYLIPTVGVGRFVLNSLQGASVATTIAVVLWPALIAACGVALVRRIARDWQFEL